MRSAYGRSGLIGIVQLIILNVGRPLCDGDCLSRCQYGILAQSMNQAFNQQQGGKRMTIRRRGQWTFSGCVILISSHCYAFIRGRR